MKLFKFSGFVLAMFSIMILTSCAKKSDSSPSVKVTPSMSADVNNGDWAANSVSGSVSSNVLSILGTRSDGSQMEVNVPVAISPGTYSLSGGYSVIFTLPGSAFYSRDGTLVISSNSNNAISGTFTGSFVPATGGSYINITGGTFTSTY